MNKWANINYLLERHPDFKLKYFSGQVCGQQEYIKKFVINPQQNQSDLINYSREQLIDMIQNQNNSTNMFRQTYAEQNVNLHMQTQFMS